MITCKWHLWHTWSVTCSVNRVRAAVPEPALGWKILGRTGGWARIYGGNVQAEGGGWVCWVARAGRGCEGNGTEGSGGWGGAALEGAKMVDKMPVDVIPTISEVTGRNIRDETNGSYHTVNEGTTQAAAHGFAGFRANLASVPVKVSQLCDGLTLTLTSQLRVKKLSNYKSVDLEMTQIKRRKRRSWKEKVKADDGSW